MSAFGETLATHPFAVDRPGATHEMAVEYARALDAYEAAKRTADRDLALARQQLDEGLDALNRLNAHLFGASIPHRDLPAPRIDVPASSLPDVPALSETTPQRRAAEAENVTASDERATPTERAPHVDRSDQARPSLRQRYTSDQLTVRAALAGWAVYALSVGVLGNWLAALCCGFVYISLGVAMVGGMGSWLSLMEIWGALKGGLVRAEYSHSTKKAYTYGGEKAWTQWYVFKDASGRTLTYGRGVPSDTLIPLPTRRLWHVEGDEPGLRALWQPLLCPLALLVTVPLFLIGTAVTLVLVPGLLIAALMGAL
ncbi:hypothetical protein DZF91_14420 [Actinomadura logoneensis]|uniref:Uncharacterized protein n=1 Tax=Actinomadura logoneensis TaxID=2293572 RepID=A0A372JMF1_9ACTN|nr:hypothetical protein DZF91_14420 [Actinomadura logoneensis]